MSASKLAEIYKKYEAKYLMTDRTLDQVFYNKYGISLADDIANSSHQVIIVASKLDSSTERIVEYLNSSEIPINAVFFRVFEDNGRRYLSRAWMIDPFETSEIASVPKSSNQPWNGEYYVSFGHGEDRNWEDAKQYGFISAGGGKWYSRTLNHLNVGDRIWVNIPKTGYVGVGHVIETANKADKVYFETEGGPKTIYDISDKAHYYSHYLDDEDNAEYMVKVNWLKSVPINRAVSELGFFGNQNTVCKPTAKKWENTVNRLKDLWNIENIE